MNTANAKHGYTQADLRRIVTYQRSLLVKYGHKVTTARHAIMTIRWALTQLAKS